MERFLWNVLCRTIGTTEQVFIRRRQRLVHEIMGNKTISLGHFPFTFVYSGSRAEGLSSPGSDIDFMLVENTISVLPSSHTTCQQADLIMETKNLKPGFAFLRLTNNSRCLLLLPFDIVLESNCCFLSSLLYRDSFLKFYQKYDPHFVQHGPCSTDTAVGEREIDVAYCLACKKWPDEASEWIQRRRPNNWPTGQHIQDIVNDGCLLVPIGNPFSEWSHLEWRLSFSLAEKKLVHSMNHTQILCYGLLKWFKKHEIESESDLKDILCSYFLKTCLFYSIEGDSVIWNKSNIIQCLRNCFFRLWYYVREGYCPNYFIKGNNMFAGKVYGLIQAKLLTRLSYLCQNGIGRFIVYTSKLYNPYNEMNLQPEILQREIEFLTDTEMCGAFIFSISGLLQFRKVLSLGLTNALDSSCPTIPLDKFFMSPSIYVCRLLLSQLLYQHSVDTTTSNRQSYNIFMLIKNILYTCRGYDICTALLHYATLCYNTGQFRTVVCIAQFLLGKFKRYTLYYGIVDSISDKDAYMSNVCARGLTYEQKMQAVCRVYQVPTDSHMYVCDIEPEIKLHSLQGLAFIPPVVYLNVLLFLSCKKLGCTDIQYQTLKELYKAAFSDRFVTEQERPMALALLGKCVQIHNE